VGTNATRLGPELCRASLGAIVLEQVGRSVHQGASGHRVASLPPEPATDPDGLPALDAARPVPRSPPHGELVVRDGPMAGLRFELHQRLTTVGRSGQANCPLEDEAVSRRHFELEVTPSGVELRDLGSGNGTRVNGRRVEQAFLRDGDRIVAGNSTIEFRESALTTKPDRRSSAGRLLSRRRQRWQLSLVFGLPGLTALALVATIVVHRRQSQQRTAEQAFERGRAELIEDPPDPELALADFLAAERDYPDRRALRDAIAEARSTVHAIQQLALARELANQHEFAQARRQLQGLPVGAYFARMAQSIGEEIEQKKALQLATPRPPIPVIRTLPVSKQRAPIAEMANEDRAQQLCDEADALLGRNPEEARQKYQEALKIAQPGGEAAQRAEGGLAN
jgi:pSer/pThr/pTyr-binding forkhead associated (FHA) protein